MMWGWDSKRAKYRNLKTGRFLSAADVRALAQRSREHSKHRVDELAQAVARGEIPAVGGECQANESSPKLYKYKDEAVSISESDVDKAITEWNRRMLPTYRGLLEAIPITTEMERELEEEFGRTIQCPYCREFITENDSTCYHCGYSLTEDG